MKKLLRSISCVLVCLLLVAATPQAGLATETDEPAQETQEAPLLIILLDVSGTMSREENDKDGKAIKWAAGLTANCGELGIEVKMFTFGEYITDIDSKAILDAGITYKEKRTKHLDAINEAKNIVDENPTRKTCIVMLSDGALDLEGRGINGVPTYKDRTADEKKAINDFLEMCTGLGDNGCKLFLVGCGTSEGNLDDIYAIKGFAMFHALDKEKNCKFLRINEMDLSELTQYVFHSLGYQNSAVQNPQMNGNTITFSLDQPYYRTHVCVSKTSDDAIKEEQTVVRWEGNTYQAFHVNNDYASMLVVCLESPNSGSYEIVLPELENNTYTVLNQTNLNEPSIKAELRGDQVKYVGSNPLTYTVPEGKTNGELELYLELDGLMGEDIQKCCYTVSLERTDGITDISGEGPPLPIEWKGNLSQMVVPLMLPEPSPQPDNVSAVTYTIQAYLTTKDGKSVYSDPIIAQPEDLYEPSGKHFTGVVGEKINISPSEWPGLDENTSLDTIDYYMLDQELVKGENLVGKTLLSPTYNSSEYEVVYGDGDTVTICFNRPGKYFMAVDLYGNLKADATGDFDITEKKTDILKVILIAICITVVVASVISVVSRKKRSEREF